MKLKLIAPLAAMLFGLSACTIVENAPYMGYQGGFAVGGPLYYADGPVTWHYYDGYTYHLIDHHGRFVGYAYYDYDHFYRIADIYGNIVYFLRWSNNGWRIHDHRNRHLGFIRSGDQGGHWFVGLGGRRHGALNGWGRSGGHGHAHANRHDDRVERRESRRQHDAERGRWRDKKRDATIRKRQQKAVEQRERNVRSRGNQGSEAQSDDRELERRKRNREESRNRENNRTREDYRGGQSSQELNITPTPNVAPAAPAARRNAAQPQRNRGKAAPQTAPSVKSNKQRGGSSVDQPRRAPAAQQPRRAPAAAPRSPAKATAAPKQAAPKQAAPKPAAQPAAKQKGQKAWEKTEKNEGREDGKKRRNKR